jgi:putative sigma-54 modulation protein
VNIAITFRQMDATEAVKVYATEKIAKIQKFLRTPMKTQVTLSCQHQVHRAEADVSAGGEHYHAHEQSADMYASIDKLVDKLERQVRAAREAATANHKGAERASDRLLPNAGEE